MKLLATLVGAAVVLTLSAQTIAKEPSSQGVAKRGRYEAEIAVAWNQRVLAMAEAEGHFDTLKGLRTASMMHLAMHDALNAIHRECASYAYSGAAKGADPTTAAAQAAYEIAVSQYPGRKVELKRELDKWLASVKGRPAKTKSITLGRASAAAILKQRTDRTPAHALDAPRDQRVGAEISSTTCGKWE